MPIYQFKCNVCNKLIDRYLPLSEWNVEQQCELCGSNMNKVFSASEIRSFKPQIIDLVDEKEKPIYVRNSSELRDSIKRYNDTPQAQKTGKVAILEQLKGREF